MNRALQLLIGFGCLGFGLYETNESLDYARHGTRVTGRVVENVHRVDEDGHSQRPVVEFVPQGAGAPVRFRSSISTAWLFGYRVGQPVPVVYLAADPAHEARIDGFLSNWLGPILLSVLGVFALFGQLVASTPSRWGFQWTERE